MNGYLPWCLAGPVWSLERFALGLVSGCPRSEPRSTRSQGSETEERAQSLCRAGAARVSNADHAIKAWASTMRLVTHV